MKPVSTFGPPESSQRGARRGLALLGLSLLTLPFLSVGACSSSTPTEIVAGVHTQLSVPDHLRSVGLVVQVGGEVRFCDVYAVADGRVTLPATLGVLGETGLEGRGEVTVGVLGFRADESEFERDCVFNAEPNAETDQDVTVIRRRRLTFAENRILYLPLPLKESCSDVHCGEEGQTCIGGKCVTMDVDADTLVDYKDSLVFGNTNTCFDANRCLSGRVPVLLEDPATCQFRALWPDDAPKPKPGGLNVRMYYRSFGSEVLDLDNHNLPADQQEGFSFVDPEDPLVFRLAPNLCESVYRKEKILAVEASALCTAKRALQPLCDDYDPPNLIDADKNDQGSGLCTLASLEPVESVVYVLMDHSLSMDSFFGDGGLQFAIGLPLSSPVAARTKVGFDLLPADADQCGDPSAYEEPRIPIGSVDAVREPIGVLLQGEVLADNPPEFLLEAALLGAYQGVAAVVPNTDEKFNRRALVVISNSDILGGSCTGPTALELATDALAGGVYTYAVALDKGEDEDLALSSVTALANAGGTQVFDGVNDEADGARAVNDILTELGTCLYNPTRLDKGAPADLAATGANISYLNPLSARKRVDIPFAADCSEAATGVSGWNLEGGLVRVCGGACKDLRKVISDVGVAHALRGHVSPAVPVVVTAPCDRFQP